VRDERVLHDHQIYAVSYTHSGNLVTAGLDNRVKLWTPTLAPLRQFAARTNDGVMAAAVDPAEKIIVAGNQDGTIDVWDLGSGAPLQHLREHAARVWELAFSPDGKTLYSGSDDGTVKIWDVGTWKSVASLDAGEGGIVALALSPDGKTLATGHRSAAIVWWDVAARAVRLRIGGKARDHGSCTDIAAQSWVDDAHRAVVAAACKTAPHEYLSRVSAALHLELQGKVDVVEHW
jgi:WD40 repeat protein